VKVVAIIQARMGSTRLPGKVLRVLGGATVLAHVVRRAQRASNVDAIVVATTSEPRDDAIVKEAERLGVGVYRGSENDVLSRYRHAAEQAGADVVVRVTADCPLLDAEVLQAMVARFLEQRRRGARVDYLSNTLERSFPRGLDVEVFTYDALARADAEARDAAEREHVTPHIYLHPAAYAIEQQRSPIDHSRLRWTLDTEEDWNLLQEIFARLNGNRDYFATSEILELIEKDPHLSELNAHVPQKSVHPQ
jgi:spore coat polysaccharide biosynthesis protein SpsF